MHTSNTHIYTRTQRKRFQFNSNITAFRIELQNGYLYNKKSDSENQNRSIIKNKNKKHFNLVIRIQGHELEIARRLGFEF